MKVVLRMELDLDETYDSNYVLSMIQAAVKKVEGVKSFDTSCPIESSEPLPIEENILDRRGVNAEQLEDKIRRSFYDACITTLIQDLLMRNGEDAPIVRETLIRIWKSTILRQHREGLKIMEEEAAGLPEEQRARYNPEIQDRYVVSLVEQVETEFRSIFSSPIAFDPPESQDD